VAAVQAPADRRIGRYVVGERIGKGGMAEVFIGYSIGARGFRKPVAIKRLTPAKAGDLASAERLIDEAKLLVGLQHGNVVSVLDLVCEGDNVFVVMEYVDGPSVRQLVQHGERLPIAIANYVVQAAAAGLDYAHQYPGGAIIHADVSPSNLLLMRTGEVRVADFGIARREGAGEGYVEGKFAYMAPEQARGELLSPKADVFALGVVLYELVSGVRPQPVANDPADIAPLHVIAPEAPRTMSALVRRCLSPVPAARPSMAELRDTLAEVRFVEHWRDGARELSDLIREAALPEVRMPSAAVSALISLHSSRIAPEPKMIAAGTVKARTTEPVHSPRISDVLRAMSDDVTVPSPPSFESIPFPEFSLAVAASGPQRPSQLAVALALPSPPLAAEVLRPTRNRSRWLWIVSACLVAVGAAAWIGYSEIQIGSEHEHVVAPPIAAVAPDPIVEPIEPAPVTVAVPESPLASESAYREPVVHPQLVTFATRKRVAVKPPEPEPELIITEPEPVVLPSPAAAALVTSGTEHFLASRLDEAREAFQGALAVDPTNALAHRGLGFIYQRTGAPEKAIAELRSYLALRPAARDTAAIEARIASLGGE
jgi:serine/threonine protein kinase